jgi:ferritin-like protein
MARVAREVIQTAGIDVDKLLEMLVRNASAELTTFVTTPFAT